jgi:multicomponent Na+:H+ antiporter subunit G
VTIDWELVQDVLAALLLLGGSVLTLAAGVGLVRFPDLLSRTHTAAKPQVLGLVLMLLGLGFRLRNPEVLWVLVLVVLFQMLTSPVAAHMVARAGWRTGKVRTEDLVVDELSADLAEARSQGADPDPDPPLTPDAPR